MSPNLYRNQANEWNFQGFLKTVEPIFICLLTSNSLTLRCICTASGSESTNVYISLVKKITVSRIRGWRTRQWRGSKSWGQGPEAWASETRTWGLSFKVKDLRFELQRQEPEAWASEKRTWGLSFKVKDLRIELQRQEPEAWASETRTWGLSFKVKDLSLSFRDKNQTFELQRQELEASASKSRT